MQNKATNEDLMYEIGALLEAVLILSGVKKESLEKAADLYIDNIDEVLENSDLDGYESVLEVVKFLKANHSELFAWLLKVKLKFAKFKLFITII